MKKFLAAVLSAVMAFAPVCAYAQDAIGTLTYTEGRVERTQEGSFDYVPVVKEEPVRSGDVLRTKSHSMAEVRFADGSTVRLGENTQLRIPQYALDADGKRSKAQLFVDRGVVRAIVEKAKDKQANFLIDTPNMRGAIKGSDIVVGFQRSMTSLASFEGQIQAQSVDFPDDTVVVTPGNTSAITSTAPPAAPRKFLEVEKKRFEAETAPRAKAEDLTPKDLSKAIITKYSGDVRVKTSGARDWHRAGLKETLGEGDQIETGENGSVRVVLESGRTVDLKAGSHLGIKQLKVDTKTGQREDVLESLRGQLRANIDKRAGRETSFRVVTPTAVASVRGTILYLQVMPGKVTSYFEQGHGSLLGLVKQVESQLQPGQAASIDQNGDSTGPYIPSQEEIDRFRADWGDEQYGYSPANSGNQGGSFEGGDEGDGNDLGGDQNQNNLFDQLQQTPQNQEQGGPTPILWAVWNNENEDSPEPDSLYMNWYGSPEKVGEEYGNVIGLAPWDATQAFTVNGEFSEDFQNFEGEAPALLWNTSLTSRQEPAVETELDTTDAAPDGGALFGRTIGVLNDGFMQGSLAAIFVSPTGSAGVLIGAIAGAYNQAAGTWNAGGITVPQTLSQMPGLNTFNFLDYVEDGYLCGTIAGEFVDGEGEGSGWIDGYTSDAGTHFLWDRTNNDRSETWGIYNFWLGGEFNNYYGNELFGSVIGGRGSFGRYFANEGDYEYENSDGGYWLGLAGGTWENGEIHGTVGSQGNPAIFMTRTQMGTLGGEFWGVYDGYEGYGSWLGAATGMFEGQELAYYGDWRENGFYYNDGGDWASDWYDWNEGYFGGLESPWDADNLGTSQSFLAMGEYEMSCGDSYLFNTKLRSYNAYDDTSVTYDGSFFRGRLAGVFSEDGDIHGAAAAIWVRSNGDAGLAFGNMSGEHYEDLGLWYAEGEWTARRFVEGLEIDLNEADVDNASFEGDTVSTIFNEDGEQAGWMDTWFDDARKYYLSHGETNENWGFVDIRLGGEFCYWDSPESMNITMGGYDSLGTDENGYWIFNVTGDWADEDGVFRGTLTGDFLTRHTLASVNGSAYGLFDDYEGEGDFIAQALGTFEAESIAFNGDWGYEESSLYSLGYEGNEGWLDWYGEESGWIGAVTSPWNAENGSSPFLAMGDFWSYYGDFDEPLIWSSPFQSVNHDDEDYSTYDGGGFYGFSQGLWADGTMRGNVAALFMDGDGHAGVLLGSGEGSYYEGLDNLWSFRGNLTVAHSETVGDWLDAEWFGAGDYIYEANMDEMVLNGGFVSEQDHDNYFRGEGGCDAYTRFLYPFDGGLALNGLERTPTFGLIDFFVDGQGFTRPDDAGEWEAAFGGYGAFGMIYAYNPYSESYEETYDEGYWFATGDGGWDEGLVDGSFEGVYMTGSQFGTVGGGIAGLYEIQGSEDGSVWGAFAASGLGSFVGQPLTYAGQVIGGIFEFDFYDFFLGEGDPEQFGMLEGLMGGFGDLWNSASQAVPVHFLGYFEGGEEGAQLFLNVFTSYDVFNDAASTFDGGVFVGFVAGRWAGEETAGHARAFYVDPDGNLGFLSGALTGSNAEFSDGEGDFGLWRLDGELTATPMGQIDEEFEGLEGVYDIESFFNEFESSLGFGIFADEAEENFLVMTSLFLSAGDQESDEDWGLWFGFLTGELSDLPDGDFRFPMAGIVLDENFFESEYGTDTVFLGTLRGEAATVEEAEGDAGTFDAAFSGVWISEDTEDDFLTAGTITGDLAGTFERGEGSAFVEAAGAGEFQRLTQLDPDKVGYTMDQLRTFFEDMPITEAHAGLLTAMSGGIQGSMDASFFANTANDFGGIWTAIFNGTFDSTPGSTWTFTGEGISATLNNVQWLTENQQWLADVTGTLAGVPQGFTGQAGGTFTNPLDEASGTFTGVGTGTWGTGPLPGEPPA